MSSTRRPLSLRRRMPAPWAACVSVLAALFVFANVSPTPAKEPSDSPPLQKLEVPLSLIRVDDGDSIHIHWKERIETVRIMGIDTPEIQHLEHDIPVDQPYGRQAQAFLRGCLAMANRATLVRAASKDRYDRTLGYLILDGKNYSELVLRAGLALETVSRYPTPGFGEYEAACKQASEHIKAVPFEQPWAFRRRMRSVTKSMKALGTYPLPGAKEALPASPANAETRASDNPNSDASNDADKTNPSIPTGPSGK